MSSATVWLEVFNYCLQMGKRAFPYDAEQACEVASDCFDRFARLHGEGDLADFRAWVGRSIAGLKKNAIRQKARSVNIEDEALAIDRLYRSHPQQEAFCDANVFRALLHRLPEREAWAFEILADGGTLKAVMEEMHIGPREALALVHQARIKLIDWTTPSCERIEAGTAETALAGSVHESRAEGLAQ